PNGFGSRGLDAPSGFVGFAPLKRPPRLVRSAEVLNVAGVVLNHVTSGPPTRQREVEKVRSFGFGFNGDFKEVGIRLAPSYDILDHCLLACAFDRRSDGYEQQSRRCDPPDPLHYS